REVTLVGEPISQGRIAITCTSGLMLRRAVAAGLGLGEIPLPLGALDGLQRLCPEGDSPPYDIWLVTHKDVRHTARVRVVIDAIVAAFASATPVSE
ncbi:MAG TPA: LysR substrate-binding domain-containing protein, partial [Chitinolyticbacter sp.]|nr:LysR substrate-binding domain-containing protein [Chitinolyticbacter sp.]